MSVTSLPVTYTQINNQATNEQLIIQNTPFTNDSLK